MSLKTKVKNSVDLAFDKLKDLAVTATFQIQSVSGFDFNAGSVVKTDSNYTTIGFLGSIRVYESGIPITTTTLTIRNDTTQDFNRYARVTIDGTQYGCNVISKDQFIVVLSLAGV